MYIHTNISSSLWYRAPEDSDELVCVQSYLHPVVEQSKERSQRQSCHKDGDEAILDDKLKVLKEEAVLAEGDKVKVLLPAGVDIRLLLLLVLEAFDDALHISVGVGVGCECVGVVWGG